MSLGRLIRRWLPPVLLGVIALVAWRAANQADFDRVRVQPVSYPQQLETPLISARRVPLTLRAPISDAMILPAINRFINLSPSDQTCLVVRNDDRVLGTPLETSGGLIPASNQKLLTTYAALGILGSDFTFRTRVLAAVPVTDGVLDGDLFLVGDGDPFLITDDWLSQYEEIDARSHTRLEALADEVAAAGITQITGGVIGDETLYDDVRYGEWHPRLIEQKQSGPLSALNLNEGFVSWPETFVDSSRTRNETDNPPLNAAAVFGQLLQERGVTINGAPGVGEAPPAPTEVAAIESPPLIDAVTHINSYSSNLGAELLLKRLGLVVEGTGSTVAGARAVTEYLTLQGIPMENVVIFDGSGLDEDNRLTCSAIATILVGAGPDTPLGLSLAKAGERGSLLNRFVDTPAEGLVLAKTGTLRGARALSGYVESAVPTDPDAYVTFAYILNDQDLISDPELQTLQNTFATALTRYPGGPTVVELSPVEPSPR